MLRAILRFHGHGSLKFLYRNARTFRSRYFALKIIDNPKRPQSRYAVVISKKVHKSAVGRNRIRRRLYEILRSENEKVRDIHDIALIVTSGEAINADQQELVTMIRELLSQAGIYPSDNH